MELARNLFSPFWKQGRRYWNSILPYLFLLPALIFLVTFTHYPIVKSIWSSFFEWDLATPEPVWAGFKNYIRLVKDPVFWLVIKNNLIYALGTVIPCVALALFLAIFANQKIKGLSFFRSALFYPTMIPMACAAMIWVWIFSDGYGLLNFFIKSLGLASIDFLNNLQWALPSLMIVGIWKYAGYYMVIFLAGLQGVDQELYEYALIEGSNPWNTFWKITFPLISPTTFFVVIIAIINSFQSIDQVYVMTRGGPSNATNMLVYYIYQNGFLFADFGYGYTLSTVLFLILLAFSMVYFALLSRRVHYN